ncbi:MAG: hypothetical protein ACYC4Q_11935, partial [Victivallaceae bacterium]
YWQGKTGELTAVDKKLLLNAVTWAGAKPKYDVPMKDTETGLLAETMKIKKNEEDAQIAKFANLPAPKFDEAIIWAPSQWISPGVMMDSNSKVVAVMDNCKRMGFNKVGIIMKHGPCYYPSALKNTDNRENNGFYYGAAAIHEAQARNLKVALIISPFINGPGEGEHYPPDINKAEYEKIQQGKMKVSDVSNAVKWAKKCCPDHPDVRKRALDVSEEIINKYHPEELYLDFIRYKDGYDTSCFCDYSMKRKAEFAAKHPEIAKDKIDEKFAEASLLAFVKEWNDLCKKMDPNIKTSCYTISSPECKAPSWVNKYPLDWHSKYVSRHTSGPESSLEDTETLTKSYSKWMKSGAPDSKFSPMIAAYDPKSGERLLTEFKIVSDFQNKADVKFKRIEFYEYGQLLEGPKKNLKISDDMARGISQALGGSWNTQRP